MQSWCASQLRSRIDKFSKLTNELAHSASEALDRLMSSFVMTKEFSWRSGQRRETIPTSWIGQKSPSPVCSRLAKPTLTKLSSRMWSRNSLRSGRFSGVWLWYSINSSVLTSSNAEPAKYSSNTCRRFFLGSLVKSPHLVSSSANSKNKCQISIMNPLEIFYRLAGNYKFHLKGHIRYRHYSVIYSNCYVTAPDY